MPNLDSFVGDGLNVIPSDILTAVADSAIPGLAAGPQDSRLAATIRQSSTHGWKDVAGSARSLCESGLWLLAGDLDRSHEISQADHSAEGSFWHAIMHRREGDFGNSKYWFRRVGEHPLFDQLSELTQGEYDDPFEFVDVCSEAVQQGGDAEQRCKAAQWTEWQALMVHCLQQHA